MRSVIVAVGDKLPVWADTAVAEYSKRMPRNANVTLIAVRPEARRATRTAAQCMAAESDRIIAALPNGARRIVLDERGREVTTRELAGLIERWRADGRDCAFIIGGADGLAPAIKASAETTLRLSAMTLPHALARVLLAEQLYRAVSILENHPYHRD